MLQFINDFFLQKPKLGVWAILSILISPCMDYVMHHPKRLVVFTLINLVLTVKNLQLSTEWQYSEVSLALGQRHSYPASEGHLQFLKPFKTFSMASLS